MYIVKVQKSSVDRMNRTTTRLFAWLVLTALLLTTPLITNANSTNQPCAVVAYESSESSPTKVDNTASTKKVIVGSWIETVTFSGPGAPPPLKSLVTFSADGTTTVADQGNVSLAGGTVFSAGHGSWIAQGERTFSWTTVELVSDLEGNLIGTLKVRGTYTVDETGNAYSGFFKADLTIFGNTLTFEGTNEGTRIQMEL